VAIFAIRLILCPAVDPATPDTTCGGVFAAEISWVSACPDHPQSSAIHQSKNADNQKNAIMLLSADEYHSVLDSTFGNAQYIIRQFRREGMVQILVNLQRLRFGCSRR